jgi:hypothetical protein
VNKLKNKKEWVLWTVYGAAMVGIIVVLASCGLIGKN